MQIANHIITHFKRGFTLIELMIVVAIIGILATLALPEYRDYQIRSRVAEGILFASACKNQIQETAQEGLPRFVNIWAGEKMDVGCWGKKAWERIENPTAHIRFARYDNSGKIVVCMNEATLGRNSCLALVPYIDVDTKPENMMVMTDFVKGKDHKPIKAWQCHPAYMSDSGDTWNIAEKYLPSSCRNPAVNTHDQIRRS